MFYQKTKRNRN